MIAAIDSVRGCLQETLAACVTTSYSTVPNAKMSVRASGSLLFQLLWRARYGNVPSTGAALIGSARVEASEACGRERGQLPRQPEVEQLGAGLRQHHVARLEVAVNDPLAVRPLQRLGDLHAVRDRLVERNLFAREPRGESLALDILHDEVIDRARLPDVVERADVRMIQLRDGAGFTLESLAEIGVIRERRLQDFNGDRAVEAGIACLVDFPHAAGADKDLDLIRAKAGPRSQQCEAIIAASSCASSR